MQSRPHLSRSARLVSLLGLLTTACPLTDDYRILVADAGSGGEAGAPIGGGEAGTTASAGTAGALPTAGTGGAPASGGGGGTSGAGDAAGVSGETGSAGAPPWCDDGGEELCNGLDDDCDDEIDEDACVAGCSGFTVAGEPYVLCTGDAQRNGPEASAACEEQGLALAWIESETENDGVAEAIEALAPDSVVYLGALLEGSTWSWIEGDAFWQGAIDGAPVDGNYSNWEEGRPTNYRTCLTLLSRTAEWHDEYCTTIAAFVCESRED